MKDWRRIFSSEDEDTIAFVSPDGEYVSLVNKMHAGAAQEIISNTPGYEEDYFKWSRTNNSEFTQSQEKSNKGYFYGAESYIQSRGWIRVSKIQDMTRYYYKPAEYCLSYDSRSYDSRDAIIFFISTLPRDSTVQLYDTSRRGRDYAHQTVEEWLNVL